MLHTYELGFRFFVFQRIRKKLKVASNSLVERDLMFVFKQHLQPELLVFILIYLLNTEAFRIVLKIFPKVKYKVNLFKRLVEILVDYNFSYNIINKQAA